MANDPRSRPLPDSLKGLPELALDLRWSGSQFVGNIWRRLDEDAWERTRNPWSILLYAHQNQIEELARDRELVAGLGEWIAWREGYLAESGWFGQEHEDSGLGTVAYFSMEFGLSEALPIHSGGLGILAGDHMKSASDLGIPLVGVGLLYQQGYFRQVLGADGHQLEAFPFNDPSAMPVVPAKGPNGDWPRVEIELPGRTLLLRTWEATVGRTKVYLLDSNEPLNNAWDRGITANLYAAGREKRLLQEIVLGVGGWQLLEKLGLDVRVCHLNEGHAAFAVLARAASFARKNEVSFDVALRATRAGNVFTTHTPVAAAFDQFEPHLLELFARPLLESMGISLERLLALGRTNNPNEPDELFNIAYLAMRGSGSVNGVSRLHGEVSRKLFAELYPGRPIAEIPVRHVTNGVHVPTWDSDAVNELLSRFGEASRGSEENEARVGGVETLSDLDLWNFRGKARHTLVEYVRRRLVRQLMVRATAPALIERAHHVLDANALTLGFARRFTTYKRPTLLLTDTERLARILRDPERPVQLIVAGKAHPNDDPGKEMVQAFAQFASRDDLRDHVVFLEDYDMVLAQQLAGGVDIWINAPRRPNEACGTSGMKALINGGINLSILDGWWDEAYAPEFGFAFGGGIDCVGDERDHGEAMELYETIENRLVPEFYDRDEEGIPRAWVAKVRASMTALTPRFSSSRMVREYVESAYLPAAKRFVSRAANGASLAREIEEFRQQIRHNWRGLRFAKVQVTEDPEGWRFEVGTYLGDLDPETVRVELYAEPGPGEELPRAIPMTREGAIAGVHNGFRYSGLVPGDRPASHYTPRIVPHHPAAVPVLEASEVFWGR